MHLDASSDSLSVSVRNIHVPILSRDFEIKFIKVLCTYPISALISNHLVKFGGDFYDTGTLDFHVLLLLKKKFWLIYVTYYLSKIKLN